MKEAGTKGLAREAAGQAAFASEMEAICHAANSALATVVLCIDFLSSRTGSDDEPAVADAREGIRNAAEEMNRLRELARCVRMGVASSGVFRE